MSKDVVVILSTEEGRGIVLKHCKASNVRVAIFQELVEAELEQTGKKRKAGISDRFDDILDRMEEE